jgi:lysophospholipase L1-like esterase
MKRRLSWRRRIALILGGLVAGLVCAEIALRPWPPKLVSGWMLRLSRSYVLDDHLIFSNPRLRDPRRYSRAAGLPLVLALGDSFTAGYPVHESCNYPATLRRLLTQKGAPAKVIGAGLGDSGPDQHFKIFIHYALPRVRPDVVIWQFYPNDITDSFSKALYTLETGKLKPLSVKDSWLYQRQILFDRIPLPPRLKKRSRLIYYLLACRQFAEWLGFKWSYAEYGENWAITKIHLQISEMRRLERELGFRLYIVLLAPQRKYLSESERASLASKRWDRVIHYQLLYEQLASEPRFIAIEFNNPDDPPWRELFVGPDRDGNDFGDRHLSEKGYALMAERIGERLLADGALQP